jgi:formate hydrogenlyase subunit 4
LIACLFMPWGIAHQSKDFRAEAIGALAYVGKLAGAGLCLALFETTIAKMRVFRVPDFVGVALMLAFLAVLLRFVSASL